MSYAFNSSFPSVFYALNALNRNQFSIFTLLAKLSKGLTSAAGNNDVEQSVQAMIEIANDASHGYDWGARWGPDFDCSSLVYYCFYFVGGFQIPSFVTATNNGWKPDQGYASMTGAPVAWTDTMIEDFKSVGFEWHPGDPSVNDLLRGDILLALGSHTEVYIGNGQNVGAHQNEYGGVYGGQTGDQYGNEISVDGYYSFPWSGFLRYGE